MRQYYFFIIIIKHINYILPFIISQQVLFLEITQKEAKDHSIALQRALDAEKIKSSIAWANGAEGLLKTKKELQDSESHASNLQEASFALARLLFLFHS
jgi:hypothetical protein